MVVVDVVVKSIWLFLDLYCLVCVVFMIKYSAVITAIVHDSRQE